LITLEGGCGSKFKLMVNGEMGLDTFSFSDEVKRPESLRAEHD